jgi:hypothetical protein
MQLATAAASSEGRGAGAAASSGGAPPPWSAPSSSSSAAAACSFCANEIGSAGKLKACPCGLAGYCSKTCQVAHFPTHKAVCKARRKQGKVGA